MTKSKKQELIPELRFPDFKNEGNWTIKRLADFDNLPSGDGDWILSKDMSSNGSYKIVQLASIGFGSFKEKNLKTISEETFLELNGTPIEKGDLLINRMVDANKINCCIFPLEGKYITSVDVCWIRQNNSINNYFLMSLLSTGDSQIKLLSLSSGAGRVRISKSNLFENFFFHYLKTKKKNKKLLHACLF
jgi:type I restriction enzyme S subunit